MEITLLVIALAASLVTNLVQARRKRAIVVRKLTAKPGKN